MAINSTIRVSGMDKVLTNLNKEVRNIKFKTKKGLISAGFFVQGESQRRTPRALGNLISSAFTVWDGGQRTTPKFKDDPDKKAVAGRMAKDHVAVLAEEKSKLAGRMVVEVGNSAYYALYVHEDMQASHTKVDKKGKSFQQGQAKFLQAALEENFGAILNIIKGVVKR